MVGDAIEMLRDRLVASMLRRCRDPASAEDAVHSAFLRLLEREQKGTLRNLGIPPLVRWLLLTSSNVEKEQAKQRRRESVALDQSLEDRPGKASDEFLFQGRSEDTNDSMVTRDLEKLLGTLSPSKRSCVRELFLEDHDEPLSDSQRSKRRRLRAWIQPKLMKGGYHPARSSRRKKNP